MKRPPRSFVVAFVAAMTVAAGCSTGPATGTVTGEVTFDGQPIEDGHVTFTPIDGQGQTGGAAIKNGKFTAEQVPVGKMKVAISGNRVVGKRKAYDTPESPWMPDIVELLPPKYHAQSEMTLDVKRGVQNEKYDLMSK